MEERKPLTWWNIVSAIIWGMSMYHLIDTIASAVAKHYYP